MDLWVVAAVAGAGCLAKYFSKLSKNNDSSSNLSSEGYSFDNTEPPSHPFCKQAWKDELGKYVYLDRRASDVNSLEGLLTIELASNKEVDSEKVRCFRNCNDFDVLSVSDSNDVEDGNQQGSNIGGNCGFLLPDFSATEESGYVINHSGNKTFIRDKHLFGDIRRPLNSLESCLMAQLCTENAKMEECVTSSSTATMSSQIIRKFHREAGQVKDEKELFRGPSLPKIGSFDDAKKVKFNAGNGKSGRLSSSNIAFSGKHIRAQHDTAFLFSLGISIGIITSILANKREMGKLRELLKQTENLVHDLQEELQMKDSMTVKELQSENNGSQDTCDHSFCDKELNGFSPEKHMDNSPIIDCKKSHDQKEEESSESMSKIEAELEAELERLGLNMNESSPERTQSELVELNPDFVADFAQDELPTELINGKDVDAGDSMNFPGNYAVSPHELTLRLHEVIQTRLEERVHELEVALQNSQRKLRLMESEREGYSQKSFTSHGHDTHEESLVMNLSGETLGAYSDTFEELIKIDYSQENSPSGIHNTDHKVCSRSHDWHVLGVQHCGANDPSTCSTFNEERISRELSSGEVTMLEGQQSSNIYELNYVTATGDENCVGNYEVERQLIRKIVERTKKGSPIFQNARRILCSMGEDEH